MDVFELQPLKTKLCLLGSLSRYMLISVGCDQFNQRLINPSQVVLFESFVVAVEVILSSNSPEKMPECKYKVLLLYPDKHHVPSEGP